MILLAADVDGFGCLVKQKFEFGEGLTVIAGPNESGKTTLTDCIVRVLFGYPEHQYTSALEFRRPWRAPDFAASLAYRLDNGTVLETRRDFSRPDIPTQTFERATLRPRPDLTGSRKTSPGSDLLHLSMEAFEAAAVMRAGEFAQKADGKTHQAHELLAARIAAIVGSAGDAGAAAAIARLDDFLKELGSERASTRLVSVARARSDAARRALETYRRELDDMRDNLVRRADLAEKRDQLIAADRSLDGRLQRAQLRALRTRIATAQARTRDLDAAQTARGDVSVPPEMLARADAIDAAIDAWRTAKTAEDDAVSSAQTQEDEHEQTVLALANCERSEKEAGANVERHSAAIERLRPQAGSAPIPSETLDRLEKLNDLADQQEAAARVKETKAAIARQRPRSGALASLFVFGVALIALLIGALLQVPSLVFAAIGGMIVGVGLFLVWALAQRSRSAADRTLEADASEARAVADAATKNLEQACTSLGVSDIRAARRAREAQRDIDRFSAELAAAQQLTAQSRAQRAALETRFAEFDRSVQRLVGARSRAEQTERDLNGLLDAAAVRAGDLESRIAAFRDVRRGVESALGTEQAIGTARAALATVLGGKTLAQLMNEADAFAASLGVADELADSANAADDADALQVELNSLRASLRSVENELAHVNGRLADFETRYTGGGARFEEQLAACEADEARLTIARAAAEYARGVIDETKDRVHKDFAPALNAFATPALAEITHQRYTQVAVDPRDFALRVRAPENSKNVGMDELSKGTQEQLYLSLRAATAQALGSGEHVPLILDDALAHADERRLAAAVKHLASIAHRQQVLLFTQRDGVLEAARRIEGVTIIHLTGPGAVTVSRG